MRFCFLLLFYPFPAAAQNDSNERMLIALSINSEPDAIDSGNYYLIATKPKNIKIKPNQTFLLQSAWHADGDSIVNIGSGTVQIINEHDIEMRALIYPGKKVRKNDMALFLVPLKKPARDTLFFKMARLDIMFKTVEDSAFYIREKMLENSSFYPTHHLLEEMSKDIRYTGEAMTAQGNDQDQEILKGNYKGQKLFAMMKRAGAADVEKFIRYVHARPDKYKSHEWKVSETFATWVIAGAPLAL